MQTEFTSQKAAEDYRKAHQLHNMVAEPLAGNRWGLLFPLACHVEVRDGVPAEIRAAMNAEPTTPVQWLPAWRTHVDTGRAVSCGYWVTAATCSKPNTQGRQLIDCPNCKTGTQQNRFARLAVRAGI